LSSEQDDESGKTNTSGGEIVFPLSLAAGGAWVAVIVI
jgi:hypothetical protein